MPKTLSTTLEGCEYTLNPLPATEGLQVFAQLTRIVTQTLGAGAPSSSEIDSVAEGLGRGIMQIGDLMVEPGTIPLVKALLQGLKADGRPVDFDHHFAQNYGRLVDLAEWAIRGNFESFFTAKRGRLVAVKLQELTSRVSIGGSIGSSQAGQ